MVNDSKARYWTAVMYPENMIDNWQDLIDHKLQLPCAYCVHDKDYIQECEDHVIYHASIKDGELLPDRITHVHILIAFTNTTTYNNAFKVLQELNAPGKIAFNKIERVIDIRYMYNYLIHDTPKCREQGKHQYKQEERILVNNFDIGAYEQLSMTEKREMISSMCQDIISHEFVNFTEFYMFGMSNYDAAQMDLFQSYSGLFERLTKGNFQRLTK